MTLPTTIKLERTCLACPSQWEAELDDGRFLYVRYRHGCLSAGIGANVYEAVRTRTTIAVVGDGLDGYMTDEAMAQHLSGLVKVVT